MTDVSKPCCHCREIKPLAEYYVTKPSKGRPDGVYEHCKACHRAAVKASYERRKERTQVQEEAPVELPELVEPKPVVPRTSRLLVLGLRWICTGADYASDRTPTTEQLECIDG